MSAISKWFVSCLDPQLKAELFAGQHQNYPKLHWLFKEGLAEQALLKACREVADAARKEERTRPAFCEWFETQQRAKEHD